MTYIIIAHRTANSMFGEGQVPVKDEDGKVKEFRERQKAFEHKRNLTKSLTTKNVYYTVEEQYE